MQRVGRPLSFDPKSAATKTQSEAMEDWSCEASLLIKRGMKERGWRYRELAEALRSQGIKVSAVALNRRINRCNFPAGFLLACLYVLEDGKAGAKGEAGAAQDSDTKSK